MPLDRTSCYWIGLHVIGSDFMLLDRTYILLDVLMCSIAEYFYELCCILTSPQDESKYKQRVKILSDTTHQNV